MHPRCLRSSRCAVSPSQAASSAQAERRAWRSRCSDPAASGSRDWGSAAASATRPTSSLDGEGHQLERSNAASRSSIAPTSTARRPTRPTAAPPNWPSDAPSPAAATMWSSPRKSAVLSDRAQTISADRECTSCARSTAACGACKPTTSMSTSSTGETRTRPWKRP